MELKLTTKRALEYQAKTGKDIIAFLQEVSRTNTFTIQEMVDLFSAMGDGYTVEVFDAWDAPFEVKAKELILAVKAYVQGNSSKNQ